MKNTQRSAKAREAILATSQEEGQVVPAVAETCARVAELESGIKAALAEIKSGCYADAHSTLSSLSTQEAREQRPTGLRGRSEKGDDGADLRDAHRLVFESCPDRNPHARMSYMMEHGLSRGEAVIAGVRGSMSQKDRGMYLGYVFHEASPEDARAAFEAVTAAGVPVEDILAATAPMDMHRIKGIVRDVDLYNFGRAIQSGGLQMCFVGEIYDIKGSSGCSFDDAIQDASKWNKRVRKAAGYNA